MRLLPPLLIATLLLLTVPDAVSQNESPAITQRGAHHRVWSRAEVVTLPNGRARTNTSSFTELGSGMHRWDAQAGAWADADPTIEIVGNSAVANKTAHQVTFAANANTAGGIDLVTPDGKRLRSHVLGIAWFDAASGRSEMIAELKDSIGEVHAPNVVIYPDAFDGLVADLRYTVRLGGFEQDVILRERPALPAGFAPDTTRLEAWTEFIEAPGAFLTQRGVAGMTDDTLDFGAMQTGHGKAFTLGEESSRSVSVAKRWLTAEGRTFLVEAVRYPSAKRDLDLLPVPQARVAPRAVHPQHAAGRPFPPAPAIRQARANPPAEKFRMAASRGGAAPSPEVAAAPRRDDGVATTGLPRGAAATRVTTNASLSPIAPRHSPRLGFVLDYTLNGSLTNYTFQCDTTYYVSNTVHFYGTTTFEGGTVVKFAKTNTASLVLNGSADWHTAQYRPAIFTAKDDNTVGEILSGSTGTPSGYYGDGYVSYTVGNCTNENVRFSHAKTAIRITPGNLVTRHAQFVSCSNAFDQIGNTSQPRLTLENVLLYAVNHISVVGGADKVGYFTGAHLTVRGCGILVTNSSGGFAWSGQLDNSVICGLYNGWGAEEMSANNCHEDFEGDDASIFQAVGAAAHYLAAGSELRDAGSTEELSATLIAGLKRRTTWPPLVISNIWQTNWLVLSPQAQRDETLPDLGYHYDPLDYACGTLALQNATLHLQPGTAVATFSARADADYGIATLTGSTLLSEGSPTNLNRLVRYNMVQEQAGANWTVGRGPVLATDWSGGVTPLARLRFTEMAVPASDSTHISGEYYSPTEIIDLLDCQLFGGSIRLLVNQTLNLTNCLLGRVNVTLADDWGGWEVGMKLHQNTFFGGALNLDHQSADTWTLRHNLFAGTAMTNNGTFDADYNAYTTNVTRLNTSATHDVLLATNTIAFDTGPLGRFYLPTNGPATNLFNRGSTTADLLGLYHYTVTTNQIIEGTTTNDLGFHYVAVGTNGLPVDTDSDGIPDFLEDDNGNGVLDHRETDRTSATDVGFRVQITNPRTGGNLP